MLKFEFGAVEIGVRLTYAKRYDARTAPSYLSVKSGAHARDHGIPSNELFNCPKSNNLSVKTLLQFESQPLESVRMPADVHVRAPTPSLCHGGLVLWRCSPA